MLDWLLAFGEREPGHVLLPTSDNMAWLFAANQEALEPYFRLIVPPADGLGRLLDKGQLAEAAAKAGLAVPQTHCPRNEVEVTRLATQLSYPVVLKPRCQVFLHRRARTAKVVRVEHAADLLQSWRIMRAALAYDPMISRAITDLELPLIQAEVARGGCIYTLDGFFDETVSVYRSLACRKLLQLPRGSGPGVCFDAVPIDEHVDAAVRRLLRSTGFRGVFDAEFVEHRGRRLLIDLNPRIYNHMAFEVERGLPLAWMAYLAATGDAATLGDVGVQANVTGPQPAAYLHRLPTSLMLGMQALTGRMPRSQRRSLRRWCRERAGRLTDPVRIPGDGRPALAELAMNVARLVRHPRSFLRGLAAQGEAQTGAQPNWPFDDAPEFLVVSPDNDSQVQKLWFTLARRRPRSLALLALDPQVPVGLLAMFLAHAGQRLVRAPVAAMVANPCDDAFVTRTTGLLSALPRAAQARRGVCPLEIIIALASDKMEPLGLGLIEAVDALVLCFSPGQTNMDVARQAIDRLGSDRVIACVAVVEKSN